MAKRALKLVHSGGGAERPEPSPAELYLLRLSPAGRTAMTSQLGKIADFLSRGTQDLFAFRWETVRYSDFVRVLAHLQARGLKSNTRRQARTAIRGVLRECWRAGLIDADALQRAIDVPSPRGDGQVAGRALTEAQCPQLWQTALADTSPRGRRNAALLAVFYATGCRRSELRGLQLEDYDPTEGTIRIAAGKGEKARVA